MQSTAAFVAPKVVEYQLEDGAPRLLNAPAGSYRTKDGWLAVTLVKEHHFEKLCQAIGQEALIDDSRFTNFDTRAEHVDVLKEIIGEVLLGKTTEEWVATLTEHEVLCSPIANFGDWLADPQVIGTHAAPVVDQPGMGPVPIPAIPGTDPDIGVESPPVAPSIGEHGRDILSEFGFDDERVAGLVRDGAVSLPN